jgi:hypothetical protein
LELPNKANNGLCVYIIIIDFQNEIWKYILHFLLEHKDANIYLGSLDDCL